MYPCAKKFKVRRGCTVPNPHWSIVYPYIHVYTHSLSSIVCMYICTACLPLYTCISVRLVYHHVHVYTHRYSTIIYMHISTACLPLYTCIYTFLVCCGSQILPSFNIVTKNRDSIHSVVFGVLLPHKNSWFLSVTIDLINLLPSHKHNGSFAVGVVFL